MAELGPEFAQHVLASAGPLTTYYRGLMVAPPHYEFDRKTFDFTPNHILAKNRYSNGGMFEERYRGQYASLVIEYKIPKDLQKPGFQHAHNLTKTVEDERAIISRVGFVLRDANHTAAQSPLVWLEYAEAFDGSGRMKSAEVLGALAKARAVEHAACDPSATSG